MQEYLYWITALIFAVILFVILINEKLNSETKTKVRASFTMMISWVVFFCLQDCFWGLCDSKIIPCKTAFFVSSELFHFSTVLTTFFWLRYILDYLGDRIRFRKLYLGLDLAIIFVELVFVIINIFTPVLFSIENGNYITGPFRPLTFGNQYVVYLLSGIITFIFFLKEKQSKEKEKFFSVFVFTLFPILMGVFQLLYPDGPFYSLGYFLGCFVVHIFVVAKERDENARNGIIASLADIYYSMHIINLEKGEIEHVLESDVLKQYINLNLDAQEMVNDTMKGAICEEYHPMILAFVDFSTLSERMQNKTQISCEVIGRNYGWSRMTFIAVERTGKTLKKVILATQIIDEEKKNQIQLLFRSNHDELTGLYNRSAYEAEVENLKTQTLPEDFVYVSMDLNGLKITNDTLGHAAGDEILKGAADCMRKTLSMYGNIYRVGGDEFAAILKFNKNHLEEVKSAFEEMVLQWTGERVKEMSVSSGFVIKGEEGLNTLEQIALLADKRMYKAKDDYYREKGIDRRGQRDAHLALCALYTKILKINITTDTYQIISMNIKEQTKEKGFEKEISKWLQNFGTSGQVHPDDLENYLEKTKLDYIRNYFAEGKKVLSISYKRKIDNVFKQTLMDIIPANDYSLNNESYFLYVKGIE